MMEDKDKNETAVPFLHCVLEACDGLPEFEYDKASTEPLAPLDYAVEQKVKNLALKLFWKRNGIAGIPGEIVAAELPRRYRTTSKRRVDFFKGKARLLHLGRGSQNGMRGNLQYSLLEPDLHHRVYELVLEHLQRPAFHFLARNMNYCVIRGSYTKLCVIFNLSKIDASIVRKIRVVADALRSEIPEVVSCFTYLDESRSNYYLEAKRPEKGVGYKKLFGTSFLDVTLPDGHRLLYPPTGFSQVNEAMLPAFLKTAETLIQPEADARLLDLYCGYGLIGLYLFPHVNSLLGVEIDGPSVDSAVASAAHLFPKKEIRFVRGEIGPMLIKGKFPEPGKKELVVLDPPRFGTANGVIKELARRKPLRVLHIFCGIDGIPAAVEEWQKRGCSPVKIVPLDMFPGTPNLETMILLEAEE